MKSLYKPTFEKVYDDYFLVKSWTGEVIGSVTAEGFTSHGKEVAFYAEEIIDIADLIKQLNEQEESNVRISKSV